MGRALASLISVVALGATTTASADVFKLFGEIHGGGMYGKGVAGDRKDAAFFAQSPHGVYGVEIGAELLFFDAWIQHHQYTDGSRVTTWTQFGLGVHNVLDLGDAAQRKAKTGGYLEFSGGLFFGIGTGQQVMPPLDNAQLSDKAFLIEGKIGFGTHLSKNFDFGVSVPVSYGYFFKTGNGAAANDLSTNYRSIQAEGLLVLRAKIALL
ncbi:MAG: hypothetical protein JWO36_366 [Myxococcales bacterium]|nr:hypothetical protein [Myxococcales bacterium]